MVYVGISPIYRWYIAYIPMVYRPYTNSPPQPEKKQFTTHSRLIHGHYTLRRRQKIFTFPLRTKKTIKS